MIIFVLLIVFIQVSLLSFTLAPEWEVQWGHWKNNTKHFSWWIFHLPGIMPLMQVSTSFMAMIMWANCPAKGGPAICDSKRQNHLKGSHHPSQLKSSLCVYCCIP